MLRNILQKLDHFICDNFHEGHYWPSHDYLRCRTCQREVPIQFMKEYYGKKDQQTCNEPLGIHLNEGNEVEKNNSSYPAYSS